MLALVLVRLHEVLAGDSIGGFILFTKSFINQEMSGFACIAFLPGRSVVEQFRLTSDLLTEGRL